jgi:allantoinase
MIYDVVITGGRIVTAKDDFVGEMGINGANIATLSDEVGRLSGRTTIDAENKLVMPGFLDLHVHFNDPGVTHREDFLTGSTAAAAGGVTLIADMPLANDPLTLDEQSFAAKRRAAAEKCVVDYRLWGGLIDDNVDNLEAMRACGAHGFKAFTCYAGDEFKFAGEQVLRAGFRETKRLDTFMGIHCEDEQLIRRFAEAAPKSSGLSHFLDSHRQEVETVATRNVIKLAVATGSRLHICHASLPEVVSMAREARDNGALISVETCPQYLLFTTEDLHRIGGPLKCTPPVRDRQAVDGLWDQLRDGLIDFIASDHSPATREEKSAELPFSEVWGGINGIQFLFQALYTEGVCTGRISLTKLVELYSAAPAAFSDLYPRRGTLEPGSEATFVIYDPKIPFEVTEQSLLTKNRQSPYIGKVFQGRVDETWIRGRLIGSYARDGFKIMVEPGFGQFSGAIPEKR